MKTPPKILTLLFSGLISGLLGCILRVILYRTGFDEKGFLPLNHPLHLICCVLAVATAIWLVMQLKTMKKRDFRPGAAASVCRVLGGILAGGLLAYSALGFFREWTTILFRARAILAVLAAVSMPLSVFVPREAKLPRLAGRALITTYFVLDMLVRYQIWSGNPQLPDYVFQDLALVCLCLCSYHRLAFCTGIGKRKVHVFFSIMAMCLCLMSLGGPDSRTFYLSGALWAGAGMCTLTPPTYHKAETEPNQEDTL